MSRKPPKAHRELVGAYDSLMASAPAISERDVVEWKPGLRNREFLGPFVVVRLRDEPFVFEGQTAISPFHGEPLDVEVGFLAGEGDARTLTTFWADGRRLQIAT